MLLREEARSSLCDLGYSNNWVGMGMRLIKITSEDARWTLSFGRRASGKRLTAKWNNHIELISRKTYGVAMEIWVVFVVFGIMLIVEQTSDHHYRDDSSVAIESCDVSLYLVPRYPKRIFLSRWPQKKRKHFASARIIVVFVLLITSRESLFIALTFFEPVAIRCGVVCCHCAANWFKLSEHNEEE